MTNPQQPNDDDVFAGIVAALREPTHIDGFIEARAMLTELSFVERFIIKHRDEIMYVPGFGWYTYRDGVWHLDDMDDVLELTKTMAAQLQSERFPSNGQPQVLAPYTEAEFAAAMRSVSTIATRGAIVRGAALDGRLKVHPTQLNVDPWVFNVENGLLDLRTRKIRASLPEDRITQRANVKWNPEADCPRFHALLAHAFANDEKMIAYTWRTLGYMLTGVTSAQVFFFWWGVKGSSKSTIAEVMVELMGGYAHMLNEHALTSGAGDHHATWIVDLIGKRLLVKDELDRVRRINTARLNSIVSGITQRANKMRKDEVDVPISGKIVITTNPRPPMGGAYDGVWRRILPSWFKHPIPKDDVIPDYGRLLAVEEGAGILRHAVNALIGMLDSGSEGKGSGELTVKALNPPAVVIAGADEYAELEDEFGGFFSDVIVPGEASDWVANVDLMRIHEEWCVNNGVKKPLSSIDMGKMLTERQFERAKPLKAVSTYMGGKKQTQRGYFGVKLVSEENGTYSLRWLPVTDN